MPTRQPDLFAPAPAWPPGFRHWNEVIPQEEERAIVEALASLDFTAFAYDHGQQPWDPDFTYGFGLFDYRSNRVSIQYSNYSGNRFPWRKSKAGTGRFKDGGLLVSWSKGF